MSEFSSGSNARGGGGRGIVRLHPGNENKLCYTVPEVAKLLRISRNQGYELIRRDEIPHINLGNRIRIPIKAFHDKFGYFLNSEVEE